MFFFINRRYIFHIDLWLEVSDYLLTVCTGEVGYKYRIIFAKYCSSVATKYYKILYYVVAIGIQRFFQMQ